MAFVTLASACSAGDDDGTSPPAPDVEMSFSQHRIDEGSARANLRVVNNGDEPAEVTEIGLDSAGYGNHLEDHRSTIAPGQTIDLRMTLPEPVCDAEPVPAYGVATIDGRAVRERLDRFGEAFVESLWRRRCNQLAVTTVADLAWHFDFDAVGTGRASYLEGAVDLDRVPGTTDTLQVRGMQGSVLFRLTPTARPVAGRGRRLGQRPAAAGVGSLRRARDRRVEPDVPLEARRLRRRCRPGADHQHGRGRGQGAVAGLSEGRLRLTS